MCYLLRMRSGCCLLLAASLCPFIAAPIAAQENTGQPMQGFTGYPPSVYMRPFLACVSDAPCAQIDEFHLDQVPAGCCVLMVTNGDGQGTDEVRSYEVFLNGERVVPDHSRSAQAVVKLLATNTLKVVLSGASRSKVLVLFAYDPRAQQKSTPPQDSLPFLKFSTPLYLSLYAFEDKPTGLEVFSIENRRWRIAKYRVDDGRQTDNDGLIDARRTAEITFQGGSVSGSPTCGGWSGSYKLSGRRIDVDADVSLIGLCLPEAWSESLALVKAFKGELSIEKAGDEILLLDKDGRARARLVPIGLPPSFPTK